jgi:hypothetical protein
LKQKEELIMAVENATSRLKILIQKGIASNEPQSSIIARAVVLINETTSELEKYTDDKDFIQEQITGLNKLLNSWMNTYLLGLNKIAKINDSSLLKSILDNYKLLDKNNIPIKTLKNGGITIASLNEKDLVLAKEGITNIRDLMSNPVEAGVGRYVDYGKRLREEIAKLNEAYAENPAAVSDSKGNKKNLRAMAEIKVRYDLISEDLKDKDAKYVMATSHPNASERCSWWQGKLFKVDMDVESRRMYQYNKAQSQAMCKPLPKEEWVDGIPTYSLKTAVECGFLSYNCQHRLIKYYKGLKAPKYSLIEVEKKRNLTTYQRALENKIRQTKMIETISGRNSEVLRKNPFTHEMERMSASDYSKLLQEKYKQYCENNNLVQYTWRLRITKEERGTNDL